MHLLLFPFFFLHLALINAWWLTQYSFFLFKLLSSLWYVSFVFFLLLAMTVISPTTALSKAKIKTLSSPTPQTIYDLVAKLSLSDYELAQKVLAGVPPLSRPINSSPLPKKVDYSVLKKEKDFWLDQLKLQPYHRDVLVNLATLSDILNEPAQSEDYFKQAKKLDPNYFENPTHFKERSRTIVPKR